MIAAIKDQGFSELVTTETFTGLTVLMKGKSMKLFFFLRCDFYLSWLGKMTLQMSKSSREVC